MQHELYALLNFLYPDVFTDARPFDKAFNLKDSQVDDKRLEQAHHVRSRLNRSDQE